MLDRWEYMHHYNDDDDNNNDMLQHSIYMHAINS